MENNKQIIISILEKILGSPKKSGNIKEYEFNCKSRVCRNDEDKYNLAYNSKNNIFHCWKCKYKGHVQKLVSDYGNQDDLSRVSLIIPRTKPFKKEKKTEEYNDMISCSLPEGFKYMSKKSDSKYYKAAVRYMMRERGWDWDKIRKHNIGYTENKGNRKYRIIFPSYNDYGQVNYYVGRTYYDVVKPNYMGPPKEEVARTEIIFNSKNVNFDIPVFLVEGVFDASCIYNSIPMLGKEPANVIIKKLVEHNTRVVLCLDEDALYDSIEIYNKLSSYGLDVYFVEIPDDIDEFHKNNGKQATIELLKTCRKLDFQYMFQKFALKESVKKRDYVDEKGLKNEWEKMKTEILKDQNEQN